MINQTYFAATIFHLERLAKKNQLSEKYFSIDTSSAERSSTKRKMAKTTTNLDKLVRSLKVESIYNYISL